MLQSFSIALPVSILWVLVTGRVTLGSLLVGSVIGVVGVHALRKLGVRLARRLTPDQIVAALQYAGLLVWNALVSSVQVTRLILSPRLDLHTGIVALRTGDTDPDQKLAAISAHSINMTPGQLVIDFDDRGTLFVHCIDYETTRRTLEADQDRRMRFLRRIVGEANYE